MRAGPRRLLLAAAATLASAVVLLLVLRSKPEPPPSSGKCTDCAGAVLPIHYGLLTLPAHASRSSAPQTFPKGRAYFRHRDSKGDWLEGGCVVSDDAPGWICEACGKVWRAAPPPGESWSEKFADGFWNLFR